jgi:membrane protease YdiL (CAAX protease family)
LERHAAKPHPDKWDALRFVLFFVLILIFCILAAGAIATAIWGEGSTQNLRRLGSPQTVQDFWLVLAAQVALEVSIIAAVWFSVVRRNRSAARVLAFNPVRWFFVALGCIATIALSFLVGSLGNALLPEAQSQVTAIIQDMTTTPSLMIAAMFIFAVLAPIAEEMFFRGLLFGWLRAHWPFWLTAIVTSALFGLMHGSLGYAAVAGILGLLLAYLRERTGSLWTSIVAHVVNNLFAVGMAMLLPGLA